MKYVVLFLIVWCGASGTVYGQGGPDTPHCSDFCLAVSDACEGWTNCNTGANCKEQVFSVQCSATYRLECRAIHSLWCNSIVTCVKILDSGGGGVVTCEAGGVENCVGPCSGGPTDVFLEKYLDYTIRVCMSPCELSNCSYVHLGSAAAHLYYPGASCPSW